MDRNNGLIIEQHSESGAIQRFMAQVYGWMSMGLLLTAFVAWYASPAVYTQAGLEASLAYTIATNQLLFWGLFIAQLGLVVAISGIVPRLSGATATALFMLYSVLTGLTLSMIMVAYTSESIASTFFVTAGTFGAMCVYGYTTKRDLTSWGSILFMGLIGIILASVANIWLQNAGLARVIPYIGVIVFVGLTAYDTQKLKEMGESMPDVDADTYRKFSIQGALSLYLDFINLFLMLLRIFGDRR